jgi:hypothetical protein
MHDNAIPSLVGCGMMTAGGGIIGGLGGYALGYGTAANIGAYTTAGTMGGMFLGGVGGVNAAKSMRRCADRRRMVRSMPIDIAEPMPVQTTANVSYRPSRRPMANHRPIPIVDWRGTRV